MNNVTQFHLYFCKTVFCDKLMGWLVLDVSLKSPSKHWLVVWTLKIMSINLILFHIKKKHPKYFLSSRWFFVPMLGWLSSPFQRLLVTSNQGIKLVTTWITWLFILPVVFQAFPAWLRGVSAPRWTSIIYSLEVKPTIKIIETPILDHVDD